MLPPPSKLLMVSHDLYQEYWHRRRYPERLKRDGTHPSDYDNEIRVLEAWLKTAHAQGQTGSWAIPVR